MIGSVVACNRIFAGMSLLGHILRGGLVIVNHSSPRSGADLGGRGTPSQVQRIEREIALTVLPPAEITRRQRRIHAEVLHLSRSMDTANFRRFDTDDLRRMVMLYDREFFGSALLAVIGRERLAFGLSARMTRIAGKLVMHYPTAEATSKPRRPTFPPAPVSQGRVPAGGALVRNTDRVDGRRFELVLSSTLLFQAFSDVDRPIKVTGLVCRDRLEAMQRVCEHELVHLVEMFLWNDSACNGPRFQGIAERYFGHREHRHDLITQSERAERKFQIGVGSRVRFRHEGREWVGRVNRITRRATVLVEDPAGQPFADGRRYLRFYVPLEHLRLASPT